MNRAGHKLVTKTSSSVETHYATPRVIQALMHWRYRHESPEDRSLLAETAMLYAAGMLKPVRELVEADAVRAAVDWEMGAWSVRDKHMAWLFDAVASAGWELTKAGRAWVESILAMPPPIPPRSRRT
jgi:hypothetical protein